MEQNPDFSKRAWHSNTSLDKRDEEIERLNIMLNLLHVEIEDYKSQKRSLRLKNKALMEQNKSLKKQIHELTEPKYSRDDKKDGYVYLLKVLNSDTLYKIGRTVNPDNRLKTFSVKLPFPVEYEHLIQTEDMYQLERQLHAKFKKQRKRGSEFFSLSQADVDYIKGL